MSIIGLLGNNNYIICNKTIAKKVGRDAAYLLGELCSEYQYWESHNQLDDGWFYSTVENVEENTTLSKYEQGKAIDKLVEMGWIEKRLKGIPAKRYFKINESKITSFLVDGKEFDITSQKNEQQQVKEFDSNNNNRNNNKNNNNFIADFDKSAVTPKKVENMDGNYKESDLDNLYGRQADKAPRPQWIVEPKEQKPAFTGWQPMPVINKKLRF